MTKDLSDTVYIKNPDIVFRKIADEVLLVPIRNNIRNLERIYSLNDVGARVWELIDGKMTAAQIRDCIAREFEVSPEIAEGDLQEFVRSLKDIDAVKEA